MQVFINDTNAEVFKVLSIFSILAQNIIQKHLGFYLEVFSKTTPQKDVLLNNFQN